MKAFDTDPRQRWLFAMTHPDDEMSICAWIRRLTQQGNEVHISWTHSNPIREAEARAVAVLLGVPDRNLHFFGATDGRVAESIPSLIRPFEELIDIVRPDRVVCCAYEQGHIDHDATNYLVHHAFSGPIFEVPMYHTYATRLQRINCFCTCSGVETRELTPDEQKLKIHVVRQYQSQNIEKILRWYQIYCKATKRPMHAIETERLRLKSWDNYNAPNLPSGLARRVMRHRTWKRWKQCVALADAYLVNRATQAEGSGRVATLR